MKRRKKSRKGVFKNKWLYGIVLAVIILIIAFIYFARHSPTNQPFQFKAAIVDHLSLTAPNQTFAETVTNLLTQAGFTVDYYPGENVTVEFYRNLPSYGYGLIIFRVHTTQRGAFFTSEPYNTFSYVWEQLNDQVWRVSYYGGNPPLYFGIPSSFVKSCMNGRFSETIVIAMGCDTLKFSDMAKAFIKKGAKAYIGWNGPVSASHTDQATVKFLKHLTIEKQTIEQAMTETMKEVGPDPESGSTLQYYPNSMDNYTIPNITSNLILKDATVSRYDY